MSGPEIAWGCDGLLGMLQQPEHFRVKGHGQDLDLGQGGQPALGGRVKSIVVCLGVGVGGCSITAVITSFIQWQVWGWVGVLWGYRCLPWV